MGCEFSSQATAVVRLKHLQKYVVFTAGIGATSKDAAAAKAFKDFLKEPVAAPVLKANGMEPA